ncbi:MAG: hypothetical protein J7M14_00400, partial [Planctomycetes bacterium]|nr:hypothetical protein [Planctomycetota bacterium]
TQPAEPPKSDESAEVQQLNVVQRVLGVESSDGAPGKVYSIALLSQGGDIDKLKAMMQKVAEGFAVSSLGADKKSPPSQTPMIKAPK